MKWHPAAHPSSILKHLHLAGCCEVETRSKLKLHFFGYERCSWRRGGKCAGIVFKCHMPQSNPPGLCKCKKSNLMKTFGFLGQERNSVRPKKKVFYLVFLYLTSVCQIQKRYKCSEKCGRKLNLPDPAYLSGPISVCPLDWILWHFGYLMKTFGFLDKDFSPAQKKSLLLGVFLFDKRLSNPKAL